MSDKGRMTEEELTNLLGDAISASPLERELYACDLAAVPAFLSRLLVRATPDAVARPRTTEDVSALLKYAWKHRIPVTPRSAGSTAFHNAVPTRGGILLDLTALRGIVEVDAERQTATVLAATRWKELDDELRYGWGLAVKTYPTSAPAATVGGWLNMGGYGIGSLGYGALRDLVTRAEVVLPDGEVRTLSAGSEPPLSWLAGAEGTLGAVTQLEISLRPAPPAAASHLLVVKDLAALQRLALTLAGSSPRPYHLHFADEVHAQMTRAAGFGVAVPEGYHSHLVRYEGSRSEIMEGARRVASLAQQHDAQELPREAAEEVWNHRYSEVRIKRAGPSLLGVEVWLPLSRLAAFAVAAQRLGQRYGVSVYTYGSIVSSDYAQPNAFFPADERQSRPYLFALALTKQLHDAARKLGGRPYGVGLWNTPYLGYAFSTRDLQERRERKRLLDPGGIMNPGKLYAAPLALTPPLFGLVMDALVLLRRLGIGGGTTSRAGVISQSSLREPGKGG